MPPHSTGGVSGAATAATSGVAAAATSGLKGMAGRLFGRSAGPTTPQTNNPNVRTDQMGQTILEPDGNLSDKEVYPRHQQGHQLPPHQQGHHPHNPQAGTQQQQQQGNIPSIGEYKCPIYGYQ